MTDSEVGKLWREAHSPGMNFYWAGKCIDLIRKLVESDVSWQDEVTITSQQGYGPSMPYDIRLNNALCKFGIDPATWEKK